MHKSSALHPFMPQSNNWTQQSPENTVLSIKLPVGLGLQQNSGESTNPWRLN